MINPIAWGKASDAFLDLKCQDRPTVAGEVWTMTDLSIKYKGQRQQASLIEQFIM